MSFKENWKVIEGFPEYSVSDLGRVKKNEIKKLTTKSDGFLVVKLSNEDGKKNVAVHRLVYENFGEKLRRNQLIGHFDGDKSNNSFKNLFIREKVEKIKVDEDFIKKHSREFGGNLTIKELSEKYSITKFAVLKILYR